MKNPLALLDRIADRINPIVVKELRQAVRSRYVTSILMLFLIFCFSALTTVLFVATAGDFSMGRQLFTGLCMVLFATGLIFVPVYTGVRLAAERVDTKVDLLFVSAIKPRQIISGKTLSGWTILLLLYSVCAPFLLFSYLLRGVDIPTIVTVLLLQFGVCMVGLEFAIVLACIPASRPFRVLLGLAGIGLLGAILMGWTEMLGEATFSGPMARGNDLWIILGTLGAAGGALLIFFFLAAVGMLTPSMANRTWRLRVYLAGLWAGSLALMTFLGRKYSSPETLAVWFVSCAIVLCCMLLVAVSEKPAWTRRMRRTVPRNRFLRTPFFLFYSTALGGLVWNILFAALTLGVALLAMAPLKSASKHGLDPFFERWMWSWSVVWLYTFGYALFGGWLRHRLPFRWVKSLPTFVLSAFLATLAGSVPAATYIYLHMQKVVKTGYERSLWQLGNPFAVLQAEGEILLNHAIVAGAMVVVFLLLQRKELRRQALDCRPLSE